MNEAELRTCRLHTHGRQLSCGRIRTVLPAGGNGRILATSPFSWTPDSRTILYAGYDGPTNTDTDIFALDTRGRREPVNLTQEQTRPAHDDRRAAPRATVRVERSSTVRAATSCSATSTAPTRAP